MSSTVFANELLVLAQGAEPTTEIEPWVQQLTMAGMIIGGVIFFATLAWHYGPKWLAEFRDYQKPDAVADRAEAEAAQAAAEAEAALQKAREAQEAAERARLEAESSTDD